MFRTEFSLFLGKSSELIFSGFVTGDNLFLIVEIEGVSKETGTLFLTLVKEKLRSIDVNDLHTFESCITESVRKANLPISTSIAASYMKNDLAYLKTSGDGKIYLLRKKNFAEIISGEKDASGHIQLDDMYVLATSRFMSLFPAEDGFKKVIQSSDVFSVVDTIYENLGDVKDDGIIALFLSPLDKDSVEKNEILDETVVEESNEVEVRIKSGRSARIPFRLPFFIRNDGNENVSSSKTKIITILVVIILFGVLVWSVALGYTRRTEASRQKKIQTTKNSIISKLNEAQETYSSNPAHSLELIADAKKDFKMLQTEIDESTDISSLESLIKKKEDQLTKKEEKLADEFYDLSVDNKNAGASYMYVSGDIAALLDASKKTVYLLSLSKKSLNKRTANEVKNASLIAYYEDIVYLYLPGKGIFTISDENKVKRIIENDKDWGKIIDMQLFNGNIYLLDSDKEDVYKYLVAEEGYSSKQSYFKGSKNLNNVRSMVIDSALYINRSEDIDKYNGGLATDFITNYPEGLVDISGVYTSEELEKVYSWDKTQGKVFILTKEGEYEKQISSSILKNAENFGVVDDEVFVLSSSKIYKINL